MALIKGRDLIIYRNGTIPFACARRCTLTLSAELLETTTSSGGRFKTFIPKTISWTISGDGLVKLPGVDDIPNSFEGPDEIFTYIVDQELVTLKFLGTDGTNNLAYQGSGYFTQLEIDGTDKDITTYSFTLQGTGTIQSV